MRKSQKQIGHRKLIDHGKHVNGNNLEDSNKCSHSKNTVA